MFAGGHFSFATHQHTEEYLSDEIFQKMPGTNKPRDRLYRRMSSFFYNDTVFLISNPESFGGGARKLDVHVFNLNTHQWAKPVDDLAAFVDGFSLAASKDKLYLSGSYYEVNPTQNQGGGGLFGGQLQNVSRTVDGALFTYELNRSEEATGQGASMDSQIVRAKNLPVVDHPAFYKTNHTSSIYGDKLIVFGGKTSKNQLTNDLVIFDLDSYKVLDLPDEYKRRTKVPQARMMHKSVIFNKSLCIYGGVDSRDIHLNDMWILNLETFEWSQVTIDEKINVAKALAPSASYEDKIYFFSTNQVITYEPNTKTWDYVLPQNSIPSYSNVHTLKVSEDRIIFGESDNFYSINLKALTAGGKAVAIESNAKGSDLMSGLRIFFKEKPFADVTFKIQGKEIPAHKGFLAARCPYFKKMFTSGMMEANSSVIEIPVAKVETFNALLEYIYCEETSELDLENAVDLLKLSEEFMFPQLKQYCETLLKDMLKVENVVELANLAETFDAKVLEEKALKFIAKHFESVVQYSDIRKLSDSALVLVNKFTQIKKDL